MLMASRDPAHLLTWVIALSVAMALTTVVLLGAQRLQDLLGERAIVAFERLMGLVLTALAVEMLLNGIRTFVGICRSERRGGRYRQKSPSGIGRCASSTGSSCCWS